MVMVSAVTPCAVAPPLLPAKTGMHGGACDVTFSCRSPPGAHLLLSPAVGLPSASTDCVAPDAAPAAWAVPAACVVALAPAVPPARPAAAPDDDTAPPGACVVTVA